MDRLHTAEFRDFERIVADLGKHGATEAMETILRIASLERNPNAQVAIIGAAIATLAARYVAANRAAGADTSGSFMRMVIGAMRDAHNRN